MSPFTQHRTSTHTQDWHYLKSVHQIMYTDEKIEVVGSSIVYETQEDQDSYIQPTHSSVPKWPQDVGGK